LQRTREGAGGDPDGIRRLKETNMAIQSIGATLSSSNAATALQGAGLTLQDFLQVLMTQLSYQDPLKPMDNEQFMAQMAQFSTLEEMQQQNDSTDSLLTIQSATQSVGLLGTTVQVTTSTGTQIGTVSTVTFASDGTPQLTVQASDGTVLTGINVSQVSVVQQTPSSSTSSPGPTTPSPPSPGP
jgi:flagellar basal-body rod modification protein FlgD